MNAYLLSVWLHILAAAVWIGSMVFFAAVVVPVLRRPDLIAVSPSLIRLMGVRFRVLGWIALAVLVVTGIANLYFRGVTWSALTSAAFWSQGFGRLLAWKLAFVALAVVMTAAHEGIAVAHPAPILPRDPISDREAYAARDERTRRRASLLGRLVMLVSLAILYLAVALARGFWG